mgnify:CR=1 FL=1
MKKIAIIPAVMAMVFVSCNKSGEDSPEVSVDVAVCATSDSTSIDQESTPLSQKPAPVKDAPKKLEGNESPNYSTPHSDAETLKKSDGSVQAESISSDGDNFNADAPIQSVLSTDNVVAPESIDRGTGGIKGSVVNRLAKTPVEGAELVLKQNGTTVATLKSGKDGSFLFEGLEDGSYQIEVGAEGYLSSQVFVIVEKGLVRDLMRVSLSEDVNLAEVDYSSFTEFDMADSGYSDSPTILFNANDVYTDVAGYGFSNIRFKNRGYNSETQEVYLAGVRMNDAFTGYSPYSLWSGLNEAMRTKETSLGLNSYDQAIGRYNGVTNIFGTAGDVRKGWRFSALTNSAMYRLRLMGTYASGPLDNGWSVAANVSVRLGGNDWIKGVYYRSFAYYVGADKKWDDEHKLSFATFATPGQRGAQNASTQEVYNLMGDNMYNSNWGYQNGKKRNSRVVRDFEPTAILTWDWKVDEDKKLTTAAGFKYSMYSNSALSYANNAYNPAPDYYKNFPSSVFNVYDNTINNPDYLSDHPYYMDQFNTLKEYWGTKANRQIDWDRLYYVNSIQNKNGGTASYYQERRHNDQMVFALSPTWSHNVNSQWKYTAGLGLNHTKGMHYKTMQDLLGAENYIDIDTYAERDYGKGSMEVQNDLRNPDRKIKEGDRFGYDYNIFVNKAKAWGQAQYTFGTSVLYLGAYGEGTTIEREGKMQNGRAKDYSYGKSGAARFMGYGGKAQLTFRPFANQRIDLGGSIDAQAPLARNAFVAPRVQNNFVNNLTLEKIASANLSWSFRFGNLTGKLSGYYTRFMDQVEQTGFYNDLDSRFYYVTMSGLDKVHYGFDGAVTYQVNSELSFNLLASVGEAKYVNNPEAQMFSENNSSEYKQWINPVTTETMQDRIFADGMRVSGTPLTALGLGANYNINNWYLELDLNYYDRSYLGFSSYRRMGYVLHQTNHKTASVDPATGGEYFEMTDDEQASFNEEGGVLYYTNGDVAKVYSPKQEKLNGGFMLDASIGKFIRLRKGRAISINLSLQNICNNKNLQTGGFEQNRSDFYADGEERGNAKTYKFSANPKYYYANPFNAFLNVNYRF